ncbi:hypothetical protein K439DRAFT_1612300 [Ramaria rubella]|nr:hypothetical protein K439DRAFT_1612300 [Ramaria rubella]
MLLLHLPGSPVKPQLDPNEPDADVLDVFISHHSIQSESRRALAHQRMTARNLNIIIPSTFVTATAAHIKQLVGVYTRAQAPSRSRIASFLHGRRSPSTEQGRGSIPRIDAFAFGQSRHVGASTVWRWMGLMAVAAWLWLRVYSPLSLRAGK